MSELQAFQKAHFQGQLLPLRQTLLKGIGRTDPDPGGHLTVEDAAGHPDRLFSLAITTKHGKNADQRCRIKVVSHDCFKQKATF